MEPVPVSSPASAAPAAVPVRSVTPVTPVYPTCPQCHVPVRETYYFCYNCGKNLKPAPLSLSVDKLAMYYIGAVLLPPMGIIWGWKYFKGGNPTAKIHGLILIVGTVIELIILTVWSVNFINSAVKQANTQLNSMQGF